MVGIELVVDGRDVVVDGNELVLVREVLELVELVLDDDVVEVDVTELVEVLVDDVVDVEVARTLDACNTMFFFKAAAPDACILMVSFAPVEGMTEKRAALCSNGMSTSIAIGFANMSTPISSITKKNDFEGISFIIRSYCVFIMIYLNDLTRNFNGY